MTMNEKDINVLREIVYEYSEIDQKMRSNEELLKKISAEQTKLMERLEKNELKEKKFMDKMSKKYPGMGLIDLVKYL